MSKTAYEIESELMGSAATRTGFGGRPEMINFYMEGEDVSTLPQFRPFDLCFLRCGKLIPVLTVLGQNGASETVVCGVEVAMENDEVTTVTFKINSNMSLVYTVATGEWATA